MTQTRKARQPMTDSDQIHPIARNQPPFSLHLGMRIIAAMVESEEMDLEEGTRRLLPLHAHATQHLTGLETDPTIDILTAKYRQELKSFGEIINNGVKHIQKLEKDRQAQEQEAQAQAAQEGQADPSELTPEILAMLQKHRVTLQLMEERGNAELAIRLQKAARDPGGGRSCQSSNRLIYGSYTSTMGGAGRSPRRLGRIHEVRSIRVGGDAARRARRPPRRTAPDRHDGAESRQAGRAGRSKEKH